MLVESRFYASESNRAVGFRRIWWTRHEDRQGRPDRAAPMMIKIQRGATVGDFRPGAETFNFIHEVVSNRHAQLFMRAEEEAATSAGLTRYREPLTNWSERSPGPPMEPCRSPERGEGERGWLPLARMAWAVWLPAAEPGRALVVAAGGLGAGSVQMPEPWLQSRAQIWVGGDFRIRTRCCRSCLLLGWRGPTGQFDSRPVHREVHPAFADTRWYEPGQVGYGGRLPGEPAQQEPVEPVGVALTGEGAFRLWQGLESGDCAWERTRYLWSAPAGRLMDQGVLLIPEAGRMRQSWRYPHIYWVCEYVRPLLHSIPARTLL